MTPTIDAHQHFWQLDRPFDYSWLDAPEHAPIRRDFLPADLEPLIRAAGVDRTVFVQTQHDLAENRWLLGLAEQHDFVAGVVGWVDLASPACEDQLLEARANPKFVGVRHVTHDEPDDEFIVRANILRGLAVLERHKVPFDLLFYVQHLRHVPALATKFPGLPMVIDHMAKPRIRDRVTLDWLPDFTAAAAFPNVWCKVSGLITEADWLEWTVDDLKPYVRAALDLFGRTGLMFGSDWPVCELAGTYLPGPRCTGRGLGPVSEAERARIFAARRPASTASLPELQEPPMTQPSACTTLGLAPSFGFGDRLGLADAGHVAAMRRAGAGLAPIFPQQSIREMARTGRSPLRVMDDALDGMRRAGWSGVDGADADHLKTAADSTRRPPSASPSSPSIPPTTSTRTPTATTSRRCARSSPPWPEIGPG
jgi:L-fuconolactonase